MYRENDDNLLFELHRGEPVQIRWGAWVTDTHILLREGWEFAASQEYDAYQQHVQIRIAMTSPDKYVVMSGFMYKPMGELLFGRDRYVDSWSNRPIPIEVQQFTARDVFRSAELKSWENLRAVDLHEPTFATRRQIQMRDFQFFKSAGQQSLIEKEIYIPEETVDDLFNRILQIQYPQQKEMKKKLILPESKPIVQAKIISLVG